MEAFKALMAQLEVNKAKAKAEADTAEAKNLEVVKTATETALDDAIAKFGERLLLEAEKSAKADKGRTIKSRGIAMVHSAQGGPANGRPNSLLMKSASGGTVRRVEIVKACRTLRATKLKGAE